MYQLRNRLKSGSNHLMSRDLVVWRAWAPALLDNYMLRSMLGRHYMSCRRVKLGRQAGLQIGRGVLQICGTGVITG